MIKILLIFIVGLEVFLLAGSYRILISEGRITAGEQAHIEGWGTLSGQEKQDSIVCKYFDGKKTINIVRWYSPNDVFGVSGCHFLEKW